MYLNVSFANYINFIIIKYLSIWQIAILVSLAFLVRLPPAGGCNEVFSAPHGMTVS